MKTYRIDQVHILRSNKSNTLVRSTALVRLDRIFPDGQQHTTEALDHEKFSTTNPGHGQPPLEQRLICGRRSIDEAGHDKHDTEGTALIPTVRVTHQLVVLAPYCNYYYIYCILSQPLRNRP